jgi:diguanylate cyclase (GGDEF)-like protein
MLQDHSYRVSVAAAFVSLTVLAIGDLMEIIPFFAPLVANPLFPFFHETHDLLALMVALYAAHKLNPAVGYWAVAWFVTLHLPYAYLVLESELPELLRLGVLSSAALFGIYIIAEHKRIEVRLDQIAARLETQQADERRRADELEALRVTANEILSEAELPHLLQIILARAVALLHATGGDLGLYDAARNEIEIVASHQIGRDYTGTRMRLGEGAMGRVAETRESLIVADYQTWDGRSPQYAQGPWHAVMAAPLLASGKLVGAIGIVDTSPEHQFDDSDLRLLNLFAQQAALALERARLYAQAARRTEQLRALHAAGRALTSDLQIDAVLQTLAESARHLVNARYAALSVLGESGHPAQFHTAGITAEERARIGNPPQGRGLLGVVRDGNSIRLADLTRDPRSVGFPPGHPPMRTFMGVPIVSRGNVIGSLYLTEKEGGQLFTEDDENLVVGLATDAAIAIENARLFGEVQRLAITDSLTGLHNRRHFFELAEREFDRARRYRHSLSAIMLDIDHFKQVNDVYGHTIGDLVLQTLATCCLKHVRSSDILARYGGEEFVVLMPETDLIGASVAAERMRWCVEKSPVETEGGPVAITISLGVASAAADCADLATLLRAADTALYAAKRAGRNRVCSA